MAEQFKIDIDIPLKQVGKGMGERPLCSADVCGLSTGLVYEIVAGHGKPRGRVKEAESGGKKDARFRGHFRRGLGHWILV